MAFTKQQSSQQRVRVAVDFPDLPKFPELSISKDREAVANYQRAMEQFYYDLRTSLLAKLENLATELSSVSSSSTSSTETSETPAVSNTTVSTTTNVTVQGVVSVNGKGGSVTLNTDEISEGGANLYYTAARFTASFGGKSTSDLAEGANLYWTTGRGTTLFDSLFGGAFSTAVDGLTTDDLTEGVGNLYYTDERFDSSLAGKSTNNLTEGGSNLYWTDARFNAALSAATSLFAGNLTLVGTDSVGTFKGAHKAVDGSAGLTASQGITDDLGATKTLQIKDGLIVGIS
jgi:hypothetical protein